MFKFNSSGELEVVNEQALNTWLQYDRLHDKKLQIDNPIIEKILKKFSNENEIHIYQMLRQVYWRKFINEKSFLIAIENNLNQSNNIDDLIDKLLII